MASGLVRACFSSCAHRFYLHWSFSTQQRSYRTSSASTLQNLGGKQLGFLWWILLEALERVYSTASSTTGRLKEQLWRQFHAIRLTELCDIRKQFLADWKFDLDPLVQQYVNQELFSNMIKSHCSSCSTLATKTVSITREAENIVQYASGYTV